MANKPGKVVSLSGLEFPQPGQANEELVKMLEDVLQMAKAGEIVGAGIAMVHADRLASYQSNTPCVPYSLIGAASIMVESFKDSHRDG